MTRSSPTTIRTSARREDRARSWRRGGGGANALSDQRADPWDRPKVWREHLLELGKLDQNDRQVKEAMERARETIREIEARERGRREA